MRTELTCRNLHKILTTKNLSLLCGDITSDKPDMPEWLKYYKEHYLSLDYHYLRQVYDCLIVDDDFTDNDNIEYMCNYAYTIFSAFTEYEKMWDAWVSEYNPIWNVDGTETVTYKGKDSEVYNNIADTFTQAGSVIETNDMNNMNIRTGSQSREYDDITVAKTNGKISNTHSELPSVSSGGLRTLSNDEQTYNNYQTYNDTNGNETTKYNDITDTQSGLTTDTTEYKDRTDVNEKTGSMDTVYGHVEEHVRGGNIGVTSTQNLISQEMEMRKKKFFDRVFADWATWFTKGVFEL